MNDDPLRAMREDLARGDSLILGDLADLLREGASVDEATAPARAGLALRALREYRGIVAGMVADGVTPGRIRRALLAAADDPARAGEHSAFLRRVLVRALDAELGPGPTDPRRSSPPPGRSGQP